MNKIFISIAAYRDKQLIPTIKDLLNKAKKPDNLCFGICWQHDEEDDLSLYKNDKRFRVLDIDYRESLGACWARSNIQQKLYDGENYYLQLDSHHRFIKDWDEKILDMFSLLEKISNKPLITAYCPVLDINDEDKSKKEPLKIVGYEEFSSDGNLMLKPHFIENYSSIKSPIPARFVSGHFIFSKGNWVKECPYDPSLYFHGEEVSLSIRSYTNGYDLYHPNYTIAWHEYIRSGNKKHWDDHKDEKNPWWGLDQKAKKRLRKLLKQEDNEENLEKYNIGNVRSFHDYELYTGIDFCNKKVGKNAKLGSNPILLSEEEWIKEIGLEDKDYNLKIEWDLKDIEDCEDCDFWFFGIESLNNNLLHRSDFNENNFEVINKKTNKTNVSFKSSEKPHHFVIWPHSRSKGWLTKYTKNI